VSNSFILLVLQVLFCYCKTLPKGKKLIDSVIQASVVVVVPVVDFFEELAKEIEMIQTRM